MGWTSGAGINAGHELGHKKTPAERLLARFALAPSGYGHFNIEHNRGHHRDVATPEDPASSRLGESYYRFMRREIPGAIRRSWGLERERLARQGHSPLSMRNEIVQNGLITLFTWACLVAWLGPAVIPFVLLQLVGLIMVLWQPNIALALMRSVYACPGRVAQEDGERPI